MRIGEPSHVTAHSINLAGEGVARHEGKTLLCPGLFPSEQGHVQIDAVSRHHARAHGRLLELTVPHTGRRTAPCPNHERNAGRCSGCALMELDDKAQREVKRTLLANEYGLHVSQVESVGPSLGYRWASKRVAARSVEARGPNDGAFVLGSYARGSHEPASMTGCLVEHPRLKAAFDQLEELARKHRIVPFDERTGEGDLRYVWAKTNGQAVILTLITGHVESRAAELLPSELSQVAGVCRSVQGARGNQLRGSSAELLCGQAELSTSLLDQTVPLGALGFLQPNPQVAELAYRVLTGITPDDPTELALDLYAGAGITTRHLMRSFTRVIPCEAYPESAHSLGVEPQDVATFLEKIRAEGLAPNLIVANPPRKGLGPVVCELLRKIAAPQLRIMSCGPEGLARDLTQLAPAYELTSLRAFDTLPQTPHVELVAQLRLART